MARILCTLGEIPDGGSKGILPNARGRHQGFLVRRGRRVFGYVKACPHYDKAPLGWKKDELLNGARDRIMCSAHGALFRIEDGICGIGPYPGQALQPIKVSVDGEYVIGEIADAVSGQGVIASQ